MGQALKHMDDQEYNAQRDELISRFRKSLSQPLAERYFGEDELISVFDYATDLNDDYLRIEVLLCGARFYPESEELNQRRGIFYDTLSDTARDSFIEDNASQEGMIWDIMRLRRNPPSDDKAEESLDYLLSCYDTLSDEDMIQLAQLTDTLGQYEWLKKSEPVLRKKVEFLPVALYELGVAADRNDDAEFGIRVSEELTRIEPFCAIYWQLLARHYSVAGDDDKADQAVEYAIAINPDDAQAYFVKASCDLQAERPIEQIIPTAEKALALAPDNSEPYRFVASLHRHAGNRHRAQQVLREALTRFPEEALSFIPDIVMDADDADNSIDEILDQFYRLQVDNSEAIWVSWVHFLSSMGMAGKAQKVVDCYYRNSGLRLPATVTAESYFVNGRYAECIDQLYDMFSESEIPMAERPALSAMLLVALCKNGETDRARQLVKQYFDTVTISSFPTVASRLQYIGSLHVFQQVSDMLDNHVSRRTWREFNPLFL